MSECEVKTAESNKEHIRLLYQKQGGLCAKCGAKLTTFNNPLNDRLFCGECWEEPVIIKKVSKEESSISNTITPQTEESPSSPKTPISSNGLTPLQQPTPLKGIDEMYQWACLLTTEQKGEEDEYYWTPETHSLFIRLLKTQGNLIALIGLQGTGKTALRLALAKKLTGFNRKVLTMKWIGNPEKNIISRLNETGGGFMNQNDSEYIDSVMAAVAKKMTPPATDLYSLADVIAAKVGSEPSSSAIHQCLRIFHRGKNPDHLTEKEIQQVNIEINGLLPRFEKLLGGKEVKELREGRLLDGIFNTDIVLIDLPDYDRQSRGEKNRDLTAIQLEWTNLFSPEGVSYDQHVSLVLFCQKELYHGHFFEKKLDIVELKPLSTNDLVIFFKRNFETKPFTDEAITEIASLSRGIFRRFKKYIRICIDKFEFLQLSQVDRTLVNEWIGVEQVEKDMELELMTIFPKEKVLRYSTVKLLQLLRQKGPLPQSQIVDEVFEGAEMQASRVLKQLEICGYVNREWGGNSKIVSLNLEGR